MQDKKSWRLWDFYGILQSLGWKIFEGWIQDYGEERVNTNPKFFENFQIRMDKGLFELDSRYAVMVGESTRGNYKEDHTCSHRLSHILEEEDHEMPKKIHYWGKN